MSVNAMSSSRPYVVRALYDWIVDNDCTPYVLVDATAEGVVVPRQYIKNGQIVLNISPSAVMDLMLENAAMQFNARFGGVPTQIYVPMSAVLGIYARENGQGMLFDAEQPSPPDPSKGSRPSLKVVK